MLKRLLQCLREYKRATILTPIFMVGEVTCECIIPLLTAKLINGIQAGCTMEFITNYGLALLAMALLSLGFGALSLSLIHILSRAVTPQAVSWARRSATDASPSTTAS